MLGTTLGVAKDGAFSEINRSSFGSLSDLSDSSDADFWTGKPSVQNLGYAFLFRNYRPELGKWQTADPLGYPDGWNNLAYVNNGVTMAFDWLGGWTEEVHHAMNNSFTGASASFNWNGTSIDAVGLLNKGSDAVDSAFNQAFGPAYQHGMRKPGESLDWAMGQWADFIESTVRNARELSDRGRINDDAGDIKRALDLLGQAMHAFQDSLSPSHSGFQIWDPPNPILHPFDFQEYLARHTEVETLTIYNLTQSSIDSSIRNQFYDDFKYIIAE